MKLGKTHGSLNRGRRFDLLWMPLVIERSNIAREHDKLGSLGPFRPMRIDL